MGQSDAVYEVVSLQREAERSNEGRGRLASPTEEEEADEGMAVFFHSCSLLVFNQSYSYSLLIMYNTVYPNYTTLHNHQ